MDEGAGRGCAPGDCDADAVAEGCADCGGEALPDWEDAQPPDGTDEDGTDEDGAA